MIDYVQLFVYGTLKRFRSANDLMVKSNGVYVCDLTTEPKFTMYNMGFPAVVKGGDTAIKGEVWTLPLDYLHVLDRYEGHPNLFIRAPLAPFETDIQMYLFAQPIPNGRDIIESGEF